MKRTGGVIAIIAGICGAVAAIIALIVGGLAIAFGASAAIAIEWLGWVGLIMSCLVAIMGFVVINANDRTPGILLIILSVMGLFFTGAVVAAFMAMALIGGVFATFGSVDDYNSGEPKSKE